MIIESHPERLLDRPRQAFPRAVEAGVAAARAAAPKDSGEYAGSIRASTAEGPDQLSARIGSPLPQAGAVERGANVGPRRGPHMRGQPHMGAAGPAFVVQMTDELRRIG